MSMAIESLHFVVTGEALTKIARDFVLEKRWEDAINLLKEGLIDFSYDNAISVLKGERQLTGNSMEGVNIVVQDEEDEDYKKYIEGVCFIYGNILKLGDKYYQPYAFVTNYGPYDIHDNPYCRFERSEWRSRYIGRELHYANDPQKDKSYYLTYKGEKTTVLFGITEKPPFWLDFHKEAQECLGESVSLHERGHNQFYPGFGKEENENKNELVDANNIILLSDEEKEELAAKNEEEYQTTIEDYKKQIVQQANQLGEKEGWLQLSYDDNGNKKQILIPKRPFIRSALAFYKNNYGESLTNKLQWQNVCPMGLKLMGDDPDHSDWYVGAGLDLNKCYQLPKKFKEIISKTENKFIRQFLPKRDITYHCVVFHKKSGIRGNIIGEIVKPNKDQEVKPGSFIVIPNASQDYYISAMSACKNGSGLVITEAGGELSHLGVISLEGNFFMVRCPEAMKIFAEGDQVIFDIDEEELIFA